METITLAELFAGAGGMALGASQTGGFRHLWVTDRDPDCCRTISQLPVGRIIETDIEDLDIAGLPPPDGLCFGFPCNDFSQVGKRLGTEGAFGKLYRHCVEATETLRPLFFVGENVGGFSSGGGLQKMLNEFDTVGYETFPMLYQFEKYGLPQRRHRWILVGWRKDSKTRFRHPPPTGEHTNVKQALAGLAEDAPNNELPEHSFLVKERLKHIRPGENVWSARLPEHLRIKSATAISQIYRRLKFDEPSYTVTGSGGGGTHLYHPREHRALTNRERARLQTFPDWFKFAGGKQSVRKQIGNALPPAGAKIVFEAILKHLRPSTNPKNLGNSNLNVPMTFEGM